MKTVARSWLARQPTNRLIELVRSNTKQIESFGVMVREARCANDWLEALGRAVPHCLMNSEYIKTLFSNDRKTLNDPAVWPLIEHCLRYFDNRMIEDLAETTMRTRPEHLWSVLFHGPLLDLLREEEYGKLEEVLERFGSGVICVPNHIAEQARAIANRAKEGRYRVPPEEHEVG